MTRNILVVSFLYFYYFYQKSRKNFPQTANKKIIDNCAGKASTSNFTLDFSDRKNE